jgi:anaerobic dimethyl sulfoxide reductase subunit B (iron-sulfur subunit)
MSAGSFDTEVLQEGSLTYKAYNPNKVFSYSLSMSCNHCVKPACQTACPAGAIGKRDDGIVFIDKNLCTGCGICASTCPYGAPSMNPDTMKMEKCDMCRELITAGEGPACVDACSMNALDYGDIETLKLQYPMAVQQVYPIEGPAKTNPSLLIVPHRKYTGETGVIITSLPEELISND